MFEFFKNNNLKKLFSWHFVFIALIFCIGIYWLNTVQINNWRFDDSFFGYTYSRNIAEGSGFTFNGEKELGTSAPLPALLYGFVGLLLNSIGANVEIYILAEYISIAVILITSVLIYLLVFELTKSKLASFVASVFLYFNVFYLMMFGHESLIAILFGVLAIYFAQFKRFKLAYFILALAFLCRAETIFIAPIILYEQFVNIPQLYKKWKEILGSIFLFILPIAPWYIFSYLYFGQLTSNSFEFKILQTQLTHLQFLINLQQWITSFYINNLPIFILTIIIVLFPILAYASKKLIILNVSLILIPFVFYILIDISFYHWFLFLLTIAMSINIGFTCKYLFEKESQEKFTKFMLEFIFIAMTGYILYGNAQITYDHAKKLPYPVATVYQEIGKYLQNTEETKSIAYVENGQIAYFSKKKIVDLTGMTTKDVIKELKTGNKLYAYENYKPDFVLFYYGFIWISDPNKSESFNENYYMKKSFKYDGKTIYLYERVDGINTNQSKR